MLNLNFHIKIIKRLPNRIKYISSNKVDPVINKLEQSNDILGEAKQHIKFMKLGLGYFIIVTANGLLQKSKHVTRRN